MKGMKCLDSLFTFSMESAYLNKVNYTMIGRSYAGEFLKNELFQSSNAADLLNHLHC